MTTWWRIEDARPEHIPAIAEDMRPGDAREVWASHRFTPMQALADALGRSPVAWTCIIDERPAFMWGAARVGSLMSQVGAPWLLATPVMDQRRVTLEFLRQCPAYVARMQACFPRLENIVHAKHRSAVRWLRWLGFTFGKETVTRNGEDFLPFWKGAACL